MPLQDGMHCTRAKLSMFLTHTLTANSRLTASAAVRSSSGLKHSCLQLPWTRYQKLVLNTNRTHGNSAGPVRNEAQVVSSVDEVKGKLSQVLEGLDRGIFGVKSAQREEIQSLLSQLESQNRIHNPTANLEVVAGDWKLLYSTITIQGSRRTRLGLREVISLGDFIQRIDVDKQQSSNIIKFEVRGLALLQGSLTVDAAYTPVSPKRVEIKFLQSTLVPSQLQRLFEKNYDLLLSIFNPDGWLDITYVDASHRIGRDDKGNIFYLERC